MIIGKDRTNQPVTSSKELEDSLGTKLYKHHLSFSFVGDEDPYSGSLDLIAITNSSMVESIGLEDIVSSAIILTNVDENNYVVNPTTILDYGFTEDILREFIGNKFEFDDLTIGNITDTITPL